MPNCANFFLGNVKVSSINLGLVLVLVILMVVCPTFQICSSSKSPMGLVVKIWNYNLYFYLYWYIIGLILILMVVCPTFQICSSSQSPMGFTFDSLLANSKLQLANVQHSIFNISRYNFATIESHSTNWKLQDIHQRCQL